MSALSPQQQQEMAQLATLLSALTQPDTATIRQAEASLKPVLKRPESMLLLMHIVTTTTPQPFDVGCRHVAAIVLRKRLPAHFSSFDGPTQEEWHRHVLQALSSETVRPVQAGLVGVVAAIQTGAPSELLLQFLSGAASSQASSAQLVCCLLVTELAETIGNFWHSHATALAQLLSHVLSSESNSNNTAVQIAAVTALGRLLCVWADEDEPLSTGLAALLPTLLHTAARHANDDDDFLATVLDVLYDLCYATAPSLSPHGGAVLEFCLQIVSTRTMELRIRDAAALVIATTAEAKPKTLGRSGDNLLGRILDALFMLMQESNETAAGALFESNPAWRADLDDNNKNNDLDDDNSNDNEYDSPTETSMAQGTLDMLACEIPKKYIWEPCVSRCVARMESTTDANARKAGVAGLGVVAEGCAEPLTAALPTLLPYVFRMAADPVPQVRECACFCLGQISEHCQPDILQYASQILPIIFALLDDHSVAVQATSCYVLEMFCERLEPSAVRPVLDSLVRKLAAMLEATTKRSVQEMAVAALAATAVAAEAEFGPYVPGVATLMTKLMALQDPAQYSLRGRALECMGHMAIAVSRDTFRPYFPATMQCAMEGLTLDSTDLQEFAYAVFANLSKVMKEEFAPALPDLVPFLMKVIEQDETQFERSPGVGGGGDDNFGGLDDSDDESESGNLVLHVRTAMLEAKKGAITALGEMAAHTGTSFCPHLEGSMQVLQKAAKNWHPIIKCEVAEAFPSLIIPSIAAYHNGEIEWKKGDVSGPTNMSAHTAALVGAVLTEEIALMNDEQKDVVHKACEAIQSVIELIGPHALTPVFGEVNAVTYQLLVKAATCQTGDAYYGESPDDDDDHDSVTQAACDLVGAFGRVLGPQFAQCLPQFLPPIVDYAKSSRPPSDRSMAIGCISEIAQELEVAIHDHWQSVFLPCVQAGLVDPDDNVKRNAAFCLGMCAEHLRERIVGDYPGLLQQVGTLFSLTVTEGGSEATSAAVDNAAAAVARMIMACPSAVPLQQVLPVFLKALPLKTDVTENETVYTCLLGLLSHADMQANAVDAQRIMNEACQESSSVDEEIKVKLRAALNQPAAAR